MINSLFAVHLIPILFAMLLIDVFGIYDITGNLFFTNEVYVVHLYYTAGLYHVIHFMLRIIIAHYGYTATAEGERIKTMMSKITNNSPNKSQLRVINHDILIQFQTRNLKLRNIFFDVNWNIVVNVSDKNMIIIIDEMN